MFYIVQFTDARLITKTAVCCVLSDIGNIPWVTGAHHTALVSLSDKTCGVENSFYFHPNLISTLDPGLAAGSSLNLTLGSISEWARSRELRPALPRPALAHEEQRSRVSEASTWCELREWGMGLLHQREAGVSSPDLDPACRDDDAAQSPLALKICQTATLAKTCIEDRIDGRGLNHDSLEHAYWHAYLSETYQLF